MSKHRANAQFERAEWRLRILLPAWTLQLGLTLAMLGLFAWRLGETLVHYDDKDEAGKTPVIEIVWEGANVGMSFIASICTIVEIAKYFGESLTPWTMLFTHVIKLTCACAILALDVVIYVQRKEEHYSLIGLGLDAALITTALALVIYATITYRRLSAFDHYARPVNVKSYGYRDGHEMQDSRHLGVRASFDGRNSWSGPRLSFSSTRKQPLDPEVLERTPSTYDHERDTQFEEYVNRRGSFNGNTNGSPSPPLGTPGDRSTPTVGTVAPHTASGRLSRATSHGSDHILVAVPEEDVEMLDSKGKDNEALLGRGQRDSLDEPAVLQEVDVPEPKWQRQQ